MLESFSLVGGAVLLIILDYGVIRSTHLINLAGDHLNKGRLDSIENVWGGAILFVIFGVISP